MEKFHIADVPKTDRITHLVDNLYAKMPVIESARAKLITESYQATEGQPVVMRQGKADIADRLYFPLIRKKADGKMLHF